MKALVFFGSVALATACGVDTQEQVEGTPSTQAFELTADERLRLDAEANRLPESMIVRLPLDENGAEVVDAAELRVSPNTAPGQFDAPTVFSKGSQYKNPVQDPKFVVVNNPSVALKGKRSAMQKLLPEPLAETFSAYTGSFNVGGSASVSAGYSTDFGGSRYGHVFYDQQQGHPKCGNQGQFSQTDDWDNCNFQGGDQYWDNRQYQGDYDQNPGQGQWQGGTSWFTGGKKQHYYGQNRYYNRYYRPVYQSNYRYGGYNGYWGFYQKPVRYDNGKYRYYRYQRPSISQYGQYGQY